MKVLVIMGTRTEAIKLAPVISALHKANSHGEAVETVVCSSGQHREMLAQALSFFDLAPDISLDAMQPGQTLNSLASRVLAELDDVLLSVKPDWVLVQGDTTTAFCAALAAFHRNIAVGHIEAGLRTGDLSSPFPEEANRSLVARIANRHFAPTALARANLLAEGTAEERILVTGNTVVDSIEHVRSAWSTKQPTLPPQLQGDVPQILVTCHRRENFGDVMLDICRTLKRLCQRYPAYRWVFPVHLNPAVREPVLRELSGIDNLVLTDPVDYSTSLYLISRSTLVVSDSGGIQEEAPTFGVPAVVMRNHTERREGVDAGFAILAGQSGDRIEAAVAEWLDDPARRQALLQRPNPYGDGHASSRIVSSLLGQHPEAFLG